MKNRLLLHLSSSNQDILGLLLGLLFKPPPQAWCE